jgi:imidazolonepropionase
MTKRILIGPFSQILTMDKLAAAGPLSDQDLEIIPEAGVRVSDGCIIEIDQFQRMKNSEDDLFFIETPSVLLPGFIDAHTHICFNGSRSSDYALRLRGATYQEIAAKGGGILDTVRKTRIASKEELILLLLERSSRLAQLGITTCEVKSGYGLTLADEIKILEAIREAAARQPIDLIPTCLAAHTTPWEFSSSGEYLNYLSSHLLPLLAEQALCHRIDIFVDEHAFSIEQSKKYLKDAKEQGFTILLHADQFSRGGAQLAAEVHALSADHLECSIIEDFTALQKSGVIPIVLPGSSLGLGTSFAPARKILNAHLPLVIASDWNPGSAPMGNLLTEAAILGAAEKLTMAETLAALTVRASKALELTNLGVLEAGMLADMIAFPCKDYREILYHQGSLKPHLVFKKGYNLWKV